jgi:hypothetical protein
MADETHWIEKGTRIRAEWLSAKPVGLAGAQMKLGANFRSVTGTVVAVKGDAPKAEDCKEVFFYVEPDEGGEVVEVRHSWVKEVLS